jgi:hypothetical protein
MGLVANGDDADGDEGKFYIEAAPQRPAHCIGELHETPTGTLAGLVEEVVAIEGPVHIDEIIERIRSAWGLKRAGGRIQQAIEDAAKVAVGNGKVARDGDFLVMPDADVIVRDRSLASSTTLRRADRLPPAEVAVAILEIVRANFGATRDQIVQAVSRAVGNKATSSTVREMIEGEIDRVLQAGRLVEQSGLLVIAGN